MGETRLKQKTRNSENRRGLSLQETDTRHSVETDALDLGTTDCKCGYYVHSVYNFKSREGSNEIILLRAL